MAWKDANQPNVGHPSHDELPRLSASKVTAKGQTSASHVHDVQVLDSEAPAAEVSNAALPPEAHILTAEELDAEMNGSGSSADVTTHSCGVVALITPHPVEVSGENESLASATSEASVPVADMLEVEEPAAEVFEFGPEEFAADLPDGELPVTILLQDELLAAHTVESECPTAEMATAEAPGPAEVPEYLMAETPERALESEISVLEAPSVEVSDAESPELEVAGTSGDASTSKKAAASCIMLKGCVDTDDGIVPEEEMAAWAAQIHRFGREYDVELLRLVLKPWLPKEQDVNTEEQESIPEPGVLKRKVDPEIKLRVKKILKEMKGNAKFCPLEDGEHEPSRRERRTSPRHGASNANVEKLIAQLQGSRAMDVQLSRYEAAVAADRKDPPLVERLTGVVTSFHKMCKKQPSFDLRLLTRSKRK